MLNGFDISANNGRVNWPQIPRTYSFVACKALEGATLLDSQFAYNYSQAKANGFERMAYNFSRPATSSALQEAQSFLKVVNQNGGFDYPPILDLEDAGGLSPSNLQVYARVWGTYMTKQTGFKKAILYSYSAFIQQYGLGQLSDLFDLYLADYIQTGPPDLGGWPTPQTLWQRSNQGQIPGITGDVDIDLFNGTLTDLQTLKECVNVSDSSLPKDIPANSQWATAVQWALDNKLMFTYQDDTFQPDKPVSRGQMAVSLMNLYKLIKG